MIQIVAAIVVSIWFFRSARARGKRGVRWALLGVIALLAPSVPWGIFARLVIFPALIPELIRADVGAVGAAAFGLAIGAVGVALGLGLVYWIHRRHLRPAEHAPAEPGVVP